MSEEKKTLIRKLENQLKWGAVETERLQEQLKAIQQRDEKIRQQVFQLRNDAVVSLTDGVRACFAHYRTAVGTNTVTHWLRTYGYDTGAKSFYHSVYASLRAMPDVVQIEKAGESMRFILHTWSTPTGWKRRPPFKKRKNYEWLVKAA